MSAIGQSNQIDHTPYTIVGTLQLFRIGLSCRDQPAHLGTFCPACGPSAMR
jgi:hypothetical protein